MTEELKEGLKSQIIACEWDDLASFLTKTEMIVVDPSLVLEGVGVALAQDQVDTVKAWLDKGLLRKVDVSDDEHIKEITAQNHFQLLVVSPFALIQPKS